MNKIRGVFRFGKPYLAPYWRRLLAGILLGLMFGMVNASFIWATKTMFERLDSRPPAPIVTSFAPDTAASHFIAQVNQAAKEVQQKVDHTIDPWLPRRGRALDAWQILGGLLFLPLLIACRGTVGYLSNYCLNWVSENAVNDLRVGVLAKLNSLSLDFFHRSKMGDLLTQINGDTFALQRALGLGFGDLIKEPMTILCILGGLLLFDWKLTLVITVFLPLCVVPMFVLGKKIRRAAGKNRDASVIQMSLLVEALSGIRVIKSFSLENEQLDRFRKTCKEMFHHGMKSVQARGLINPIIEVVAMIGVGILLTYIVYSGTELPDLIAFLTGTVMLFEPIKKLAGVHAVMEQTSTGVNRLMRLLDEKPSIQEAVPARSLPEFKKSIQFENVFFSYDPGKKVVENLNLEIPRGYKLGVAGESGSGKSTLINLLMRFYDPTSGVIRIDGLDLREIAFRDLRAATALVSQEIVIFDQSVTNNIACGRRGATQAEVEAAAKGAFAHDFIMQLPQGYDTVLGERGSCLSVGQRQRLAIARAFIRNAPILLLDEATSALDSHAEKEVQDAIHRLEENKTVICIAHRLSTLANMDSIIVMAQGHVVEQGNFQSLIKANGTFAAMARKQGL